MLLEGVRVLDLSLLLPGAYCTRMLTDNGATVLKIEPPGGDPIRRLPGGDAYFEALHRGKTCLTLDWTVEEDRERLLLEISRSDVLVEGFRPGVMDRAGLSYSRLAAANPRLIACSITGFGSGGPRAFRAGHDLNYLAASGVLGLMPRAPDGSPMIPSIQIADHAGGLQAAFLIGAALAGRSASGRGGRLEVSMTDVMRDWAQLPRLAQATGVTPVPLSGTVPCYRVYRVLDGYLAVAALEQRFWREFCRLIGRPDLVQRQFEMAAVEEVQSVLAGRTRAAWMEAFDGRDVCVEPCLEPGENPP
jgi:crotonobetainyl-CoA:carnitine CoA-transferase CaiB-like acyl-CoA transferase